MVMGRWPQRLTTTGERLDLNNKIQLTFEPIDTDRFYAVKLARQALQAGLGRPTVLNAANEVAVEAFLAGKLSFSRIEEIADKALQTVSFGAISTLDDVFALDREARAIAGKALAAVK